MTVQIWLTFAVSSAILLSIPGPNNLMVMAYGLRHGTKAALFTVFGVVPGAIVGMFLSFIGLGGILATSAMLFNLTKWVGAAYLVYLGIKLWVNSSNIDKLPANSGEVGLFKILIQSFTVSLLNPKGIIFYMAFMPQFISSKEPIIPQMLLLSCTFVLIIFPINTAYAFLAGRLKSTIEDNKVIKILNRTGGALLILAGIVTATLKRNS